jgi:hypothetical protein
VVNFTLNIDMPGGAVPGGQHQQSQYGGYGGGPVQSNMYGWNATGSGQSQPGMMPQGITQTCDQEFR